MCLYTILDLYFYLQPYAARFPSPVQTNYLSCSCQSKQSSFFFLKYAEHMTHDALHSFLCDNFKNKKLLICTTFKWAVKLKMGGGSKRLSHFLWATNLSSCLRNPSQRKLEIYACSIISHCLGLPSASNWHHNSHLLTPVHPARIDNWKRREKLMNGDKNSLIRQQNNKIIHIIEDTQCNFLWTPFTPNSQSWKGEHPGSKQSVPVRQPKGIRQTGQS